MTIGEKIKKYRNEKNISQEELSNMLNVSRQAITKWENDLGIPDIDNLISLSKIMNISIDELIKGDGNKDFELTKEKIKENKTKKRILLLICAILHLITSLIWLFYVILDALSGDINLALLKSICVILFAVASILYFIKYDKMVNGVN